MSEAEAGDVEEVRVVEGAAFEINCRDEVSTMADTKTITKMMSNVWRWLQDGETALMKAAAEGHVERVRMLFDVGADVNVTSVVSFLSSIPRIVLSCYVI